jgi:indolepyruvate ferredoxin oxidoreductase beta subunit
MNHETNIVFAGLGGQGVVTASNITAETAFRAGFDVKQSEIHGMSQRGGSVSSDVRFGERIWSPMVPCGEAHFLILTDPEQEDINCYRLGPDGTVVRPQVLFGDEHEDVDDLDMDETTPINRRNLNVALLGVLSTYLELDVSHWTEALRGNLPSKLHAQNIKVFRLGRETGMERNAG